MRGGDAGATFVTSSGLPHPGKSSSTQLASIESAGNKAQAEKARIQAAEAIGKGDLDAAVSAYSEAIEADPSNARFYSGRAGVYMRLNKLPEALADAQKAKALASQFVRRAAGIGNATTSGGSAGGSAATMAASMHPSHGLQGAASASALAPSAQDALKPKPLSALDLGADVGLGLGKALDGSKAKAIAASAEEEEAQEEGQVGAAAAAGRAGGVLSPMRGVGTVDGTEQMVRIRFKVRLRSDYGETLWLAGNHAGLGAWVPIKGVQMRTAASLFPAWTAVVTLPLSKKWAAVTYKYVVRTADGGRVKWEDAIPARLLQVEQLVDGAQAGNAEQLVDDGAFNEDDGTVSLCRATTPVPAEDATAPLSSLSQPGAMQSGSSESRVSVTGATSEVTFQVVVNTNYGEEVFVSGSHPALGSWVPTRAIKLSTTRDLYPQWVAKVRLPLDDVGTRTTLYKYLIKASGEHYNWEDRIPDREMTLEGPETFLNDGRFNQIQRQVTYHKLDPRTTPPPPNDSASNRVRQKSSPVMGLGAGGSGAQGEAAQELKGVVARNRQLNDQVAELQRKRAVELAEISSLKSKQMKEGTSDSTMKSLAEVQRQLMSLEEARKQVHDKARLSGDELDRLKEQSAVLEQMRLRLTAAVQTEQEKRGELQRKVEEVTAEVAEATVIAQECRAELAQLSDGPGDEEMPRMKQELEELMAKEETLVPLKAHLESQTSELQSKEKELQAQLLDLHQAGIKAEKEMEKTLLSIHQSQSNFRSELEGLISGLVKQRDAAQVELKAVSEELKKKEIEVSGAQKALDETRHNIDQAQGRVGELEEKVTQSIAQLKENKRKLEDADAEQARREEIKMEIQGLEDVIGVCETETAHSSQEAVEAMATALEEDAKARALQAQVQREQLSRVMAEERRKELEALRDAMLKELGEDTEEQRHRFEAELTRISSQAKEMEEALMKVVAQNQDMKNQTEVLKSALGGRRHQEHELQMSLASFESSKKSLLNELAELEGANRALESELAMQTANADELQIQIQALNTSKTTLEQQLKASSERKDALEYLMSQGRPPTDEELEELEQTIVRLRFEREELKEELDGVNQIFDALNSTVTAQSQAQANIIAAISPKLSYLQSEVEASRLDASHRDEEICSLSQVLDKCHTILRLRVSQLQTSKMQHHIFEGERQASKQTEEEHTKTYEQGNEVLMQLRSALVKEQGVLKAAQAQLEEEQKVLAGNETARRKWDQEIRDKEAYLRRLEVEKQNLHRRVEDFGYETLLDDAKKLYAAIAEEDTGVTKLKADLEATTARNEELRSLMKNDTVALSEIRAQTQELATKRETCNLQLTKKQAAHVLLLAKKEEMDTLLTGLREKARVNGKEVEKQEKRAEEVQARVSELRKVHRQTQEELQKLRKQAASALDPASPAPRARKAAGGEELGKRIASSRSERASADGVSRLSGWMGGFVGSSAGGGKGGADAAKSTALEPSEVDRLLTGLDLQI